ncbi:LACT-domain-containing protein [Backusella circina FSU 941]|nr:LACT-domain-containing protein [Backusella circina FSU 941]
MVLKQRHNKQQGLNTALQKLLLTKPQELPEDILADSAIFKLEEAPPVWKRKRFHFIFGLSFGLLLAYGASTNPAAQNHFNDILAFSNMLPATDIVDEIFSNVTNFFTPVPSSEQAFMPALTLKEEMGLKPHYPVVLIPGIISSGLESWGTLEKSRKFFRKRMWGTATMFRSVLLDKDIWTQHLKLDPVTGLDPPGVKIRAAQGLDAADYFITGYWIWAKIIENLAILGYDNNNMYLASYDWRLSFSNLEVRDQYFSKLQAILETSLKTKGVPAVVVTHSMGSCMFPYFLKWVESDQGGKGGSKWTERHVGSFVNLAGPMIGVPKAMTAMLSGETRDTMSLGSLGAYLLEKFFSRRERATLFRTWPGGSSMLPKGGDTIWGHSKEAPDDEVNSRDHSYGSLLSFTDDSNEDGLSLSPSEERFIKSNQNLSVDTAFDLLHKMGEVDYARMLQSNFSFGITTSKRQLKKNNQDPVKWTNPLESQLPIAPSMKIYCMYGVGLPTERGYYYTKAKVHNAETGTCDAACKYDASLLFNRTDIKKDELMDAMVKKSMDISAQTEAVKPPAIYIDGGMSDPIRGVETGVRFTDGDGTVPVLSLGYMCTPSGGWTKHSDLYNPGRSPVVLKEYIHEDSDSKLDVRGGSRAGDHVDILGNWEMTLDLLQIVSGKGDNVTQRIVSNIESYANKINLKPMT